MSALLLRVVLALGGLEVRLCLAELGQRLVGGHLFLELAVDPADWPAPLQEVNNQAQAAWAQIKAIRVRSDEIETMSPIPAEFRDDSYWT